MRFAPIILLLLASFATASEPPKPAPSLLPPKVTAKAGKPLVLDASSVKGKLKWRLDDRDVRDGVFIVDCKKLTFASPYNGIYKVLAITITDSGDIADASCDIEVKDGVPRPDGPPPEPKPSDPLAKVLKRLDALDARLKAL